MAPSWSPCPPGFVSDLDGMCTAPSTECDALEVFSVEEGACRRVGTPCDGSGFAPLPEGVESGVYVRPGAEDGDGTEARPYGRIVEAVAASSPGSVILLASGLYAERVVLRDRHVLGNCPAETVLGMPDTTRFNGVIEVSGPDVVVENLQIDSPLGAGVFLPDALGSALIRDVVIDRAGIAGVFVAGGQATIEGSRISRTRSGRDDVWGHAVLAQEGANVTIRASHLDENESVAVLVGAASASIASSVIRANIGNTQSGGQGLAVFLGGNAEVEGCIFDENRDVGLVATEGSSLRVRETLIRDTQPELMARINGGGIVVRGSTLEADRVRIQGSHTNGILGSNESNVSLRDVLITGTMRDEATDSNGLGLYVYGGGTLEVLRTSVLQSGSVGVAVQDDVEASLVDLRVEDVALRPDGLYGYGLLSTRSNTMAQRVSVRRASGTGILIDSGRLDAQDLDVADTRPAREGDGRAIQLQQSSAGEVNRFRAQNSVGIAIASADHSELNLQNVHIVGVVSRACGTSCESGSAGIGALAIDGSSLRMSRFAIEECALCGVLVGENGASLDLEAGRLTRNVIGACVHSSDYGLERITTGVVFEENELTIDSRSLPVPMAERADLDEL